MTTSEQELPRAFKGIWIPSEIWLHPDLGYFEKILWAEIDSLDDQLTGCFASNAYLCKLLKTQERTLQSGLSRLKNLGLIRYESFDGRKRVLRSCLKTTHEIFDTPKVKNSSPIENRRDNIDKNPPPPSSKQPDLDATPTKEEEEEIQRRLKERPKNAPKIKSMKLWTAKVLTEIRSDAKSLNRDMDLMQARTERAIKHRKEAEKYEGKEITGYKIRARETLVEFSKKGFCCPVPYDCSDEEWSRSIIWK